MNGDGCALTFDVPDLKNDGRRVGADHHGEPVPEIPHPDGVAVGVQDLVFAQPVLERGSGDDRLTYITKLTCDLAPRQRPILPQIACGAAIPCRIAREA